MRTTHKDSSNFSLKGDANSTDPLNGGIYFVPKITVDRTVQKNIHLFTERDSSHLDADVFAVSGIAEDTDLRYASIQDAIDNCPNKGTVQVIGNFDSCILPSDKDINLKGVGGASIGFSSYDENNTHGIYQSDENSTQEYGVYNLSVKNSGGYGVYIKGASKVIIEDCKIFNNGWDGTGLHTMVDSATSGLLGYDSNNTELSTFYSSSNVSDNGGAIKIQNTDSISISQGEINNNNNSIVLEDCGILGSVFPFKKASDK